MSTDKKSGKVDMSGGQSLGQNPFGALGGLALPSGPVWAGSADGKAQVGGDKGAAQVPEKNRGRVDVLREKNGRGGKTVTVAAGFTGIGLPEKEALAKKMQKACGVGGTVKDGRIEIQGDKREEVARILTEAGFRAVFAGG
ncbi:translation initiation factor [Nibricoccus aquaticus]|uniref:Translation initiation factor n=1 Tax=Nibricoccus aquaticus TaxID=2576891 RepID=A0A290QG11_9BACT|nr:translation initiation factor [Nibricoccus aquaticus]ATC62822.1 translation initiation factor [Nibricoccus aquaticus]